MPGTSWKTALVGYILIGLDILKIIADAVQAGGMPTNLNDWILFAAGLATGIGLILSKDYNVSNAERPAAPAIVSAANMVRTNPQADKDEKAEKKV